MINSPSFYICGIKDFITNKFARQKSTFSSAVSTMPQSVDREIALIAKKVANNEMKESTALWAITLIAHKVAKQKIAHEVAKQKIRHEIVVENQAVFKKAAEQSSKENSQRSFRLRPILKTLLLGVSLLPTFRLSRNVAEESADPTGSEIGSAGFFKPQPGLSNLVTSSFSNATIATIATNISNSTGDEENTTTPQLEINRDTSIYPFQDVYLPIEDLSPATTQTFVVEDSLLNKSELPDSTEAAKEFTEVVKILKSERYKERFGLKSIQDKNKNTIFEGEWDGYVVKEGFGKFLLEDGSVFVGHVHLGLPLGKGERLWKGDKEDYTATGYGTLSFEGEKTYRGDIQNHVASGYGEIYSKDGNLVAEGHFKNNELVREIRNVELDEGQLYRGEVNQEGKPNGVGAVFSDAGLVFRKFIDGKETFSHSKPKNSEVLLLSSYSLDEVSYNKGVAENHLKYADKHRYHFLSVGEKFSENLCKTTSLQKWFEWLSSQDKAEWNKITGMLNAIVLLDRNKIPEKYKKHVPEYFVWLEESAVITNLSVKIKDVVDHYAQKNPASSVFVTENVNKNLKLDTGVIFVKNSEDSRFVFSEIWNGKSSLQIKEEGVFRKFIELNGFKTKEFVSVIPARDPEKEYGGINTIYRSAHWEIDPKLAVDSRLEHSITNINEYLHDSKDGQWTVGDFIGHVSGMPNNGIRIERHPTKKQNFPVGEIENLREKHVQQLIDSVGS